MTKSILFICESGISAALFVSKMLESVKVHHLDYDIDYAPIARVEEKLSYRDYDVILLAPQVRRHELAVKELILKKKCISQITGIQDEEFISMNIERILERIKFL